MTTRVQVDGALVRRPAYPWTATVHSLLRHLASRGLEVPRPVALDLTASAADGAAIGTEVVSLVPGVAGADVWPLQTTDVGLRSAAELLRRVHAAAADFTPPDDAVWAFPALPDADTICHGDPGPWNMAWRDGIAVGLFDWDLARPGPGLDDVAYALDYLAPLRTDTDALRWHGFADVPDRRRRVRLFLDAYGVDVDDVAELVLARKRRTDAEVQDLATRGVEPQRTWVAGGFAEVSAEHLRWAEANADLLG